MAINFRVIRHVQFTFLVNRVALDWIVLPVSNENQNSSNGMGDTDLLISVIRLRIGG